MNESIGVGRVADSRFSLERYWVSLAKQFLESRLTTEIRRTCYANTSAKPEVPECPLFGLRI